MDTQKYAEICNVCDLMAAKTGDADITALAQRLHQSLEQEHKPTMALVSFNMNHAERFDIVKSYLGAEIPSEAMSMIQGKPCCIMLDYRKQAELISNGSTDGIIVWGLPCDLLKTRRIAVCDEIRERERWIPLTDEIDITCLLVNATMAMNQIERTWLKECAQPLFGQNEPVIATTGMQLLNSDGDRQAVTEAINSGLRRLQISTKVFDNPREGMAWMDAFLSEGGLQQSHDRRIAANILTAVSERAKGLLQTALIDSAAVDAAVAQLESQRKSLDMAAQLAAESILFNELSRLKIMAVEGIRDYGRRMVGPIKSEVETYPLDQLSMMDQAINQSMLTAWGGFIQNMSAVTETELAKVAEKLTERMAQDAGELIARLDEPTQRALYSAIRFGASDSNVGAAPVRAPAEYSGVNVNEITTRLKKETRGMMLVSIPLLFVNPLVAVGGIIASRFIGRFRTDSELKNARADMAKQIENMCAANAEIIVQHTEASFDRQMQEGAQNVRAAYAELLARLEQELGSIKTQQGQKTANKAFLEQQLQTTIPALLSNI